MAKYGKKNKVSKEINHYSVCLLGEAGVGKTTLMVDVCNELFGEDGYMILNCGKEDGVDCLQDASYENIENYKKFEDVVRDIITNKETDYPDLKVVVVDTLDQLFELAEPVAVTRWNRENQGKKDFTPAKTLNQSWGGFGRGEDKVLQMILDLMWELKQAGVVCWSCGHTKTREIIDPLTGQTYTSLSTNMMQKYFNGIKTKMHIVGIACIDREIIKESTGRKNVVTKKEITRNQIVSESRKIIFRDDNYGVDSKSRFANIVDEIPLNKDAFIKAIRDAIECAAASTRSTTNKPKPVKRTPEPIEVTEDPVAEEPEETGVDIDLDVEVEVEEPENDEPPFDIEDETENDIDEDTFRDTIRNEFKALKDKDKKLQVREIVSEYGKLDDVPMEGLERISNVINGE